MAAALREVLAEFGIKVDKDELEEGIRRVNSFKDTLKSTISNLRNGSLGFKGEDLGLGDMFKELAEKGGEIGKVASTYGVDLNDIQRLMFQTGKGAEELGGAFRVLARNASLATKGSAEQADAFAQLDGELGPIPGSGKKAQEAFKALGISVEEVNSLSATELFTRVGEGLKGMQSPFDRITAAQAVFGRGGAQLVGALTKDADALKRLGEEYDSVGGFTEDNLKQFKDLRAAQKSEELGWQKIRLLLAEQLLPAFTAVRKTVAWFVQGFAKVTAKSNGWKLAAGAIVAVLAVMNAGVLRFALSTARAALPWIALFLVVEDLYTFITGGKSVIGDVVTSIGKKLFGWTNAGAEAQRAFANLFESFQNSSVAEFFGEMWDNINRIFHYGFGETWTGFVDWTNNLARQTIEWARDFPENAKQAASDFIDGLAQGLTGGASKVLDAIKGVGTGAVNALRNVLGMHSPSTVFTALGENADQSFATGLGAGQAQRATETLVRTPTVAGAGARTANVSNSNEIRIYVNGDRGVANEVRDGLAQAFNDDRRATLAALEAQSV